MRAAPAGIHARPTPKQPTLRRAIWMLALPAVLLTILIVAWVGAAGGDPAESGIADVLPYLIAVNHTAVFVVLLVMLWRDGATLADIGWRREAGRSLWGEVALGWRPGCRCTW